MIATARWATSYGDGPAYDDIDDDGDGLTGDKVDDNGDGATGYDDDNDDDDNNTSLMSMTSDEGDNCRGRRRGGAHPLGVVMIHSLPGAKLADELLWYASRMCLGLLLMVVEA